MVAGNVANAIFAPLRLLFNVCHRRTAPLESDDRPIGKWGRMHRAYLEEVNSLLLNHLILMNKLHAYLANLNEQARDRYRLIINQIAVAEGVNEDLKRRS